MCSNNKKLTTWDVFSALVFSELVVGVEKGEAGSVAGKVAGSPTGWSDPAPGVDRIETTDTGRSPRIDTTDTGRSPRIDTTDTGRSPMNNYINC